jgi:WD40 repeat protein
MSTNLPVIFLAFANEQHDGRYLANVVNEYKALDAILKPIDANRLPENSDQALCKVVIRTNASINDIIEVFNDFKDQIAIFHYAGHADGYQLLLEGKDGQSQIAKGPGLVSILGSKKNLKLAFLNGCSTQRLARDLADQGVPVVIGTSDSIQDNLALDMATRFYKGLAMGHTMAGAWEEAKNEALAIKDIGPAESGEGESTRSIRLLHKKASRFPWEEEFSKTSAAQEVFQHWNLPEEAKNPLRFLPKPREATLPAEPFLFLKPYEARHAEIFFGRSRYIQQLYLKILEPVSPPIILLYGETGSGKSSLLDAGLRPRLEVATFPSDPDRLLFDVRYERRDADVGLVGTLARMLEYTPEEPVVATPSATKRSDNGLTPEELAKLEQLEGLANELQEEKAKYSLLSIIESYRYRQQEKNTTDHIGDLYQNGRLVDDAGAKLRAAWKKIELATGRRLIIILDQVEELFTQADADVMQPAAMDDGDQSDNNLAKQHRELEDLLRVLKDIFSATPQNKKDEINGKIILGYREEFNAKIEARIKDRELSRTSVFLEQLNEDDIHDIFRGLQRGRAKEEYNITVDEKLMPLVSNHLLTGKSAVGPVLQLLLTKLWKQAYQQNPGAPFFSVRAFHEVQSQGKEMEEYFETQMRNIYAWNPEVVDSGLVLDILHYHVSERGTSNRRHIDTIKKRYQHLPVEFNYPEDFIIKLVSKLKSPDIFLLNDLGRGFTTLPHDTLAPVIIREYNQSDKFGQRADRILKTKEPDLIRAETAGDDEMRKLRLDDNDLEVIQEGQRGMRVLNERERQLLEISRLEREKRLRLRRMMIKGGIVAGLFILVLSIFAGSLSVSMTDQIQQGVINRANEASVMEKDKNLDKAIQLAQFAYNEGETRHVGVVKNLYTLYDDYHAYEAYDLYDEEYYEEDFDAEDYYEEDDADAGFIPATDTLAALREREKPYAMSFKTNDKIVSQSYFSDIGVIAGLPDGKFDLWSKESLDKSSSLAISSVAENDAHNIEYRPSADGQRFQALYRAGKFPFYLMAGKLSFPCWTEVYYTNYYGGYENEDDPGAVSEELDNTPVLFGYFNFFSGTFNDLYGYNYTQTGFQEYLKDFYYTEPELYVKSTGGQFLNVAVNQLFSLDLVDEERNIFRKEVYEQLQKRYWNVQNLPQLDTINGNIPIRPTHLASSAWNAGWVWHPGQENISAAPSVFDTTQLYYLTALTEETFLVVDVFQNPYIRDRANNLIATLLPPNTYIVDLDISPDHQHIFGLTDQNRIYIWDLQGRLVDNYDHPGVFYLAFSADGNRLLSASGDAVHVWSAQTRSGTYFDKPKNIAQPISFARFHADNKRIVIGLSAAEKMTFGQQVKDLFSDKEKSRIVLWDPDKQENVTFNCPAGILLDATVSNDDEGRFAVAVQPGRAGIIPNPEIKISKSDYNTKPIKAAFTEGKSEKIFLSPAGTYIVRQSLADRRIELFNHQGNRITAYTFEDGYQQGFNGQLFTPDDYYLISHRPKELFYWHPVDEKVTTWGSDYQLALEDKQQYRLDTFMDYVPGSGIQAKWWAISVILAAFIFMLLYYSDFILSFVLQKKYTELLLYSSGFFLLVVTLLCLWLAGSEQAAVKRATFYSIALVTLVLTAIASARALRRQKINVLVPLAIVFLFTLFGTVKFFGYERAHHEMVAQKSRQSAMQYAYKQDPGYFLQFYEGRQALGTSADAEKKKLSLAELQTIYDNNPDSFLDLKREAESEWPQILYGLLALLAFGGLVAYPVYRSLKRYQQQGVFDRKSYTWLFLPLLSLSLVFWVGSGLTLTTDPDVFPDIAILNLLNAVSVLGLLAITLPYGIRALKAKQYTRVAVYGLPLLLMTIILFDESGTFALALPVALLLGWLHRKRVDFGRSFAYLGMGILLFSGVLLLLLFSGNSWLTDALFEGFVVMVILGAILYGLRAQLGRLASRKAAGKRRWLNWLAIVGLGLAGILTAAYYHESLLFATEDDYEEYLYLDDATSFSEDDPAAAQTLSVENDDSSLLSDGAEAPEDALTEETLLEPESAPEEASLAVDPEENEIAAPGLPGLIDQLFSDNADAQDDALDRLRMNYRNDPNLIPTLLNAHAAHPDHPSATYNVIFLLESQSSEALRDQSEIVLAFLDEVETPDTEERIGKLRERIENGGE